jgi:gephyrin
LPVAKVKLAEGVKLDPRPEYHRVRVSVGEQGGLLATSTGGQRSSRVGSLIAANGLLCLPSSTSAGATHLDAGTLVEAIILGQLDPQ